MTTEGILVGIGLTLLLAVGCQVFAGRVRVPAIVVLLPVGFTAGQFIPQIDPHAIVGDAFTPMVGLAVSLVLFDAGLDLDFADLRGDVHRVVRRLLAWGVPITFVGASAMAYAWLGVGREVAVMLGAILVVSGPTVVNPLLEAARPGRRLTSILAWEGTMIDPIGAIIGALVFQALVNGIGFGRAHEITAFGASIGVGVLGGVVGTAVLWVLLSKVRLRGVVATEVIVATVVGISALCDAWRDDTGLIAAILMGVALANLSIVDLPEDRRFFATIVQLVIGVLFISISATVAADSVVDVLAPTLLVVAGLVIVVRPLVTLVATRGTTLTARQRAFIGWMDPRGIVAASTAATFAGPLLAAGFVGADRLLPATFLIIVVTVSLYGLTVDLAVRVLRLGERDHGAAGGGPARGCQTGEPVAE